MSEYTERVIHGKWSKFEERQGGWHTFEIDGEGDKYPTRADSSKPETIAAMMAVRDKPATFTLAERDGKNINPNSGKPYKDRYVNSVAEGHVGAPTQHARSSSGGGEHQKDLAPAAVERIERNHDHDMRSRAWAHTMSAFGTNGLKFQEELTAESTVRWYAQMKLLQQLIYDDLVKGSPTPAAEAPQEPEEVPEEFKDISF